MSRASGPRVSGGERRRPARGTAWHARSPERAEPGQVLRTIGRSALAILAPDLALGLLGAVAVSSQVGDFLVDVSSTDPLTCLAVSALLMAVAGIAAYVPARRAARIEPIVALRCE